MKLFSKYRIEIAFYNDDEIIVMDEPTIPVVQGCVCMITNLDNEQQKRLQIPAFETFQDTPSGREVLRNIAIEKARQALATYERNLQTLRESKS